MIDATELPDLAITMPLTTTARQTANEFAQQQPTPEKARQVYFNTLAVLVVHNYLQMLGTATDLPGSYSWNRFGRLAANVADLKLPGVGHLECLPLGRGDQTCTISPEVSLDRVGYVVVQIDEGDRQGVILGYVPSPEISFRRSGMTARPRPMPLRQISIQELQSLDDLLVQLHLLQTTAAPATLVHLRQWLDHLFEEGWQSLEDLLNPSQAQLAFQFRAIAPVRQSGDNAAEGMEARVCRAKAMNLGIQMAETKVALVVEVSPGENQQVYLLVQVHPMGTLSRLPPDLQLTVLDQTGQVFREVQSRRADDYIQLQFSGVTGEPFKIQLSLHQLCLTEEFVI